MLNTESQEKKKQVGKKLSGLFSGEKKQKNEKIAVVLVAVVGVAVVLAGMFRISSTLTVPLAEMWAETVPEDGPAPEEIALEDMDLETLKAQDTDEDGLNDFEEIYIYETNAYLADSDSDGIDDLQEIKNMTDPTCPEGMDCLLGMGGQKGEFIYTQTDPLTGEPAEIKQELIMMGAATAEELNAMSNQELRDMYEQARLRMNEATPEELRKILLNSGRVTKADLDKVSDEQLLEYYQFSLKQTGIYEEVQSQDPEVVAEYLQQNTTVEQVKQQLIASGLTEEELSVLDDDTLMELYEQALMEATR